MLAGRALTQDLASVTIGFLDGRSQTGQLQKFSPTMTDLTLLVSNAPMPKRIFAAERIAYIGFMRGAGDPPPPPHARSGAVRFHVSGGVAFLAIPQETEARGGTGFYARPCDAQSPFREIYFYHHGVNLKEIDLPLGELLLADGKLGTAALAQGLEAQKEQKRTPIGQILVENKRLEPAALAHATALQQRKGTRLGEVLVEAGLAKAEDIEFALAEQRKRGGKRIGQVLVELKLVSEVNLAMTLAKKFQLPFVDLDTCTIDLGAVEELPREFIQKYRVLPVTSDARTLTVAMDDPLAVDAIDAARALAQKLITEVVVTRVQLDKYIPTYLDRLEAKKLANEMDAILKGLAADEIQAVSEPDGPENSNVNESDNSIIKLANQMILDAYRRGASDIHIEPNGKDRSTTIRFRIDGDCVAYQEIPSTYRMPLVARVKIMALLDISERRKPQDGKIRFRLGEKQLELRVATIPTVNGNEDIVMRILAGSKPVPLERMNLSPRNLSELRKLITKPYGLVLCVGPTGSGKTTTLHSALGAINTADLKIWTAEDPVEITQHGLRQVQINPKIGFTFAHAMRAFLRADPDVIMVGEMRDQETASTAVEASLTGHLVFSTLHTNTAPETVTRLVDMGLDAFSFSDALLGVLAQRLARSLCSQCREQYVASESEVEELRQAYGPVRFEERLQPEFGPEFKLWRAVGCSACADSGYKGRLAIHELLVSGDAIKQAIQKRAPVDVVRALAVEGGMTTLLQDGIEKVLTGATDLKQILAVCAR
jgi:type II secretory ATPase GspE/PulE/Tfp pilus assembly ATPase PilB-like protein